MKKVGDGKRAKLLSVVESKSCSVDSNLIKDMWGDDSWNDIWWLLLREMVNGGWYAYGLKNFLENWNSLPIKDGYDKRV